MCSIWCFFRDLKSAYHFLQQKSSHRRQYCLSLVNSIAVMQLKLIAVDSTEIIAVIPVDCFQVHLLHQAVSQLNRSLSAITALTLNVISSINSSMDQLDLDLHPKKVDPRQYSRNKLILHLQLCKEVSQISNFYRLISINGLLTCEGEYYYCY